jgi:hypothetical protein
LPWLLSWCPGPGPPSILGPDLCSSVSWPPV